MENSKQAIHISEITMLESCGEQFRRRYGYKYGWNDKKEIIPPGIAIMIGIGTHKSVESNLKAKIKSGVLLDLEEVRDIARDSITGLWQQEVRLFDEEKENIKATKGASIDMAIALSALHATDLAPTLVPVSVERQWVIELQAYPYDLAGRIDIEETNAIRDTKTAGKTPPATTADKSEQLSMYALAKKVCDGTQPEIMYLDSLVKTKVPKIVIQETTRTEQDMQALLRRIERAIEIIEGGRFMPCKADDWRCSKRWCGFASTCKFFSGRE